MTTIKEKGDGHHQKKAKLHDEEHGQSSIERYDPCFTAPVCYSVGTGSVLVGIGLIVYFIIIGSPLGPLPIREIVGLSILIFIGIICLISANSSVRFRYRTGTWAESQPSTKEEIIEKFKSSNSGSNGKDEHDSSIPQVAGEGWSFFISRKNRNVKKSHRPTIVALRGNWSGLVRKINKDTVRVKTGTLFGELTRIMASHNLALYDRPQFDQMTVGGAVRTCAHGWCTYAWFIDSVVAFEAVEKGSGNVVERSQGDDDFISILLDQKYVLLEVEIKGQPNRNLHIETKRYPSPLEADEAVKGRCCSPEIGFTCCCKVLCCCCPAHEDGEALDLESWATAPYRLLFVYHDSIVTKTGRFTDEGEEAMLSNLALRVIYYRRIFGISNDWSIVDSIADAHTLVQNVWPTESLVSTFRDELNAELYATGDLDLQGSLVPLTIFHRKYGGRTEIRVRDVGGKKIYALDATIGVSRSDKTILKKSPKEYLEWFDLMHSLGITEAALHTGKYVPPSLGSKINEVSMEELWSKSDLGVLQDSGHHQQNKEETFFFDDLFHVNIM